MFRPFLLSTVAALFCSLAPAQAVLLDYWDFNSNSLNPMPGVATLTATSSGAGIMTTGYGPGTTLNAQLGKPAGNAVRFADPVAVFTDHKLTMSALDFTGLSNVSLSFAFESSAAFTLGESASIAYKIGNGSWITLAPLALPGNTWQSRTVPFGSLLDNLSGVSIRIEHHATFEALEVLAFDNLAISAVPEPGAIALLGGAAIVLVGLRRFARRA